MSAPVATSREATAERLLQASVRHSYDPLIEIDWEAPQVPGAFWLPPERSSLYGTPLWDSLDHDRRVALTRHEVANAAAAGVWFETVLMRMLTREYYDLDPRSRHAQYALTEIADECRHSVMFGRLIEALDCPAYRPSRRDHLLGRYLATTARGAHMYASILIVEEVLDTIQREIVADESLQPLIRMVCRVHVVEEARHVRFAREELVRQVAEAGRASLARTRLTVGRAALLIAGRLTHPGVYASVGLDPRAARAAARANPRFHETMRWLGARSVSFLGEQGLIAGPATALWRRSGLL